MTLRRVLTVIAVACLGVVLQKGIGGSRRLAVSGAHAGPYHQEGLLSLPAAAQGPVSAALGANRSPYRVSSTAGGFRAASPAQRLAVRFTRSGVSVASGDGRLELALRGVGYGSRLRAVGPSLPRASANRVSYARGGGVREWYANGPLGLEQGFELATRPRTGSGPLTLSLALTGDMHARLGTGGVIFSGAGVALGYRGLAVTDARGRRLRAWFGLRRGRVLVKVDDRGAPYPLRIDPFIQQDELTASNGAASDTFGDSVAVSDTTIAVGAQYHQVGSNTDQGAVYVFSDVDGSWEQTDELTASDGAGNDEFGSSVAVSGDTVVVGAPDHEVGSNPDQGAAYVFSDTSGSWEQTGELTATGGATSDLFGSSVAVSGSTIVVGAFYHKVGSNPDQGAAYVFGDASGPWTQTGALTASDGAADDFFGTAVSVSGSTIVVGAPGHKVGSNPNEGAAYLFGDASGPWTQTDELNSSGGAASDGFGDSVAVSGSTIAVGAPFRQVNSTAEGTAYAFDDSSGTWAQAAELAASDVAGGDEFGASVAVSGDTIAVGAPFHQVGSNMNQGAAYAFSDASGSWEQTGEPAASDAAAYSDFGTSVAVSGDTVAVGAPEHKVGSNSLQGAAYVFMDGDQLAVHSALVSEPSSGSVDALVAVTLSAASSSPVTVDYATQDGTATTAHGDYTATSGTLTFAPGQTTQMIAVQVNASGLMSDAGFGVVLSDPSGATISAGQATVEITSAPVISGVVVDRVGHPIPGVTVQIAGSAGSSSATTSATGAYSVTVTNGDYTVTAEPGDGRYLPQSGPDCTVSGASCTLDVTSSGSHKADFAAALSVDSVTFMQRSVSTGALAAVPDSGTYDGNTVQVEATISNAGTTALTTGLSFGRAASVAATGAKPLVAAGGASSPTVTVAAGGTATADFQWDTQGDAWTDRSQPDTDHIVRVTTDLTPGYGQETIAVRPKPVILVHGLNADYTTWEAYPAFLSSVNPDWEGYAVGDGQAPGVMNTSPVHTPSSGVGNTILGNAGQEAEYIQGVREKTGAWHVDIVAHSMGGLISRQYIDSLMPGPPSDGRPVVSHLVMLGTPNEGSPCADMLSLAESAAVAIPTLQLSSTYMKTFNSQVTNRNGVPFSILAGNIGLPTCGGPNGDSVVPEFSALWTITDHTVVPGLLHTDMTASRLAFDGWVVPHLAIGPNGGSAPTTLDRDVRDDMRARLAMSGPASTARKAKKGKKPKKGKTRCVTANGGLASATGTGDFTATRAGVTRRFTVVSASRLVLAVFAPDSAITVINPAGKTAERISAATVKADGGLFDTFTVKHPVAGSWKLTVQSVSGRQPAAYVLLEPGAATTLTAGLGIARQTVTRVAATLRTRGRGQSGAHVTALLTLPSGKRRTIRLPAVKRHAGEYAAKVKIALTKGSLPIQAVVHATKGHHTMTALAIAASACTSTG